MQQTLRTSTLKTRHNVPHWTPKRVYHTLMTVLQLYLVCHNLKSVPSFSQVFCHHESVPSFLTSTPSSLQVRRNSRKYTVFFQSHFVAQNLMPDESAVCLKPKREKVLQSFDCGTFCAATPFCGTKA